MFGALGNILDDEPGLFVPFDIADFLELRWFVRWQATLPASKKVVETEGVQRHDRFNTYRSRNSLRRQS